MTNTNLGFKFLLLEMHQQVWSVVEQYILGHPQEHEILQMVFRISACKPGTMCAHDALTPAQVSSSIYCTY
jgi:hypothetical protein